MDRDCPGSPVLRFHAPNVGDLDSIPGQGTRSHMPQLRVHTGLLTLITPEKVEKVGEG